MKKQSVVASDISYAAGTSYVNGLHRVLVELNQNLYKILPKISYDFSTLNLRDADKFQKNDYLRNNLVIGSGNKSFNEIDILLLCDGNLGYAFEELMKARKKMEVFGFIHDLLPIFHPQYFSHSEDFVRSFKTYIMKMINISTHLVFFSERVLEDFLSLGWSYNGQLHVIPLGAFNSVRHEKESTKEEISILVVNTIEPRKGYVDIMDAFDELLDGGYQVRLTIVGRYGWSSEEVRQRILQHRFYNKQLFWYPGISDEQVSKLYAKSSISIVASFEEGFGLTLEEALFQCNKVIARDIPIFRERQNDNLYFFQGNGSDLAKSILDTHYLAWKESGFAQVRTMSEMAQDVFHLIDSSCSSVN